MVKRLDRGCKKMVERLDQSDGRARYSKDPWDILILEGSEEKKIHVCMLEKAKGIFLFSRFQKRCETYVVTTHYSTNKIHATIFLLPRGIINFFFSNCYDYD